MIAYAKFNEFLTVMYIHLSSMYYCHFVEYLIMPSNFLFIYLTRYMHLMNFSLN